MKWFSLVVVTVLTLGGSGVAELAGIETSLPTGVEGGSLVQLVENGGVGRIRRPREELVWHFPHYQARETPHSAIRLGNFTLIRFYETGESRLFDLSRDLAERNDLAQQMPEEAAELTRRLDAYLQAVDAHMPTANPSYDPSKLPRPQERGKKRPRRGRK